MTRNSVASLRSIRTVEVYSVRHDEPSQEDPAAAPLQLGRHSLVVLSHPLPSACAFHELSGGEAAVVLLALMGLSNAEIAEVRGVAVRTIANQLASVYRKLGGVSRPGLGPALFGSRADA